MTRESTIRLTRVSEVRQLLGDLNIRPSRRLGQNFLVDRNIREILLRSADVSSQERILEIGPGLGVLTERLLRMAKGVVAVEKDHRLAEFLRRRFADEDGLELVCGDALELGVSRVLRGGVTKVVANLPYSVGTRMLVDMVRADEAPARIVVTVQQEVGERLAAATGSPQYGLLSVWTQLAFRVETVKIVSPTCFWPRPEVSSVIMSMHRRVEPLLAPARRRILYDLTKVAFSQRRKQLATVLGRALLPVEAPAPRVRGVLLALGLGEKARAEELGVDDWCALVNALTSGT